MELNLIIELDFEVLEFEKIVLEPNQKIQNSKKLGFNLHPKNFLNILNAKTKIGCHFEKKILFNASLNL
jgi:hypothetical protein